MTTNQRDAILPPAGQDLLTQDPASPRGRLPSLLDDGGLVGESTAMIRLGELLTRVADCDATVLIQGESGTGKELIARVLHDRSRRATGPFVAINCAALPEALLESELFGHVRGAFTSATSDQKGLFEAASGGTLFLDEIREVPAGVQAKLLRALQERAIRRVGDARERPVDVRVIAATNKNLEEEVQAGRFREDLYYRLDVISVEAPPLRERGNDVLLLAEHFVRLFASRHGKAVRGLGRAAAEALARHDWPGNVRELENSVEHAVMLAGSDLIQPHDLPGRVLRAHTADREPPAILDSESETEAASESNATSDANSEPDPDSERLQRLSEVERMHIRHVLGAVNNNKTRAAKVLGLDRRTLHRKLERMTKPRS